MDYPMEPGTKSTSGPRGHVGRPGRPLCSVELPSPYTGCAQTLTPVAQLVGQSHPGGV